jgi:hypothetical protein
MPLTRKGKKILKAMQVEYGKEDGKRVFYASIAKGLVVGAEGKTKAKTRRRAK